MFQVLNCLAEEHDWHLVLLAAAICLLASGVTIGLFQRARATHGPARLVWLGLDAAAGGCGIWATHFISMLAYIPGAGAGYDLALTVLSLVFAMVMTGVGISIALWNGGTRAAAVGGVIVGCGIAAMHFTGMLALELPGKIAWSLDLASASIVLGCLFGGLAVAVAARKDDVPHTLAAAVLLAAAIVAHHFTAMGAALFTPDPTRVVDGLSLSPASLALIVAGAAAIILGMCLVAVLSDRRSEDRLRRQKQLLDAALQNLSNGVCMFDADGRVVLFNDRYVAMMGYSAATLEGRSLLEMFRERKEAGDFVGDPQESFRQVMKGVAEGEPSSKIVETLLSGRTYRVFVQPTPGGGWVATFEDVTETRRAEAERVRAETLRAELQEQLVRSQKMEAIGTMAGGVAHELNNLLQPILMLAELLADQIPERDQASREDIATIIDHAQRARHIVSSIVTFARKGTTDVGTLDVAHEMRAADAMLRSLVPATINIEKRILAGSCLVTANRTELMQVVSNLVINASHAMNQCGSVQIALQHTQIAESEAAELQVAAGNYADLSVTDTGSGIEPRLLERIFEPFFTTKPAGQGTGLGLSVAYGIVRAWNGAMRVHSDIGRGTKFSVLVPILSS